jgi:hypothetical protein
MNEIVSAVVASVMANGILVWIFQTWFAEQVQQKVRFEYGQKLETVKAELKAEQEKSLEQLRADNAKLQAVQATANASLAEGHRAGHERRLQAIEKLWKAFLEIQKKTPMAVTFSDNLEVTEYNHYFENEGLHGLLEEVRNHTTIFKMLNEIGADVEQCRPFIGERLYSLFFVYRAVVGRTCFLFSQGIAISKIPDWRTDSGINQLLSSVLTSPEVEAILSTTISGFNGMRMTLETRALEQIQRIISGEAAADFGLEQSKKVAGAVAKWGEQSEGTAKQVSVNPS